MPSRIERVRVRVRPSIGDRDLDAALVVRTDYGHEPIWRAIVTELTQPWGEDDEREALVHIVDDPAWSDATVEEIRAAAQAGDRTVFLVDSTAIRHSHFAMLAVDLDITEETIPGRGTFRLEPAAVQEVHMQRFIDNVSFTDYIDQAARDPDNIVWSPY
ncbi:hypothetical protein MUK60_37440 [Streptomyces sp. LRE541]|uniref:DUF6924 domain-containing protein n=1 Tax=Streptomyces sp. LRE541 TaxID=2931983 RepID=UPI00200FE753|nr:hypothetical protein [Streptomyces sp. LRE541]UPZ32980.1 hypothetical protein MUK60_37440 [Streptomyces sp. LRE541]